MSCFLEQKLKGSIETLGIAKHRQEFELLPIPVDLRKGVTNNKTKIADEKKNSNEGSAALSSNVVVIVSGAAT